MATTLLLTAILSITDIGIKKPKSKTSVFLFRLSSILHGKDCRKLLLEYQLTTSATDLDRFAGQ